jgi:hypothetical protein
MERREYNGWRNRATWTCALWAQNDESIYRSMVAYKKQSAKPSWRGFVKWAGMTGERNGDGILWLSRLVDCKALTEMLKESN